MDNKQPDITVVVPVYNMGMYVERAIRHLLQQDDASYEIILVNDGSTDDSASVCEQFAARHSNISVLHKANGGLSSARNAGIAVAKGRYIIFPDPDDWVDAHYLSSLMSLQQRYGAELEICGHYVTQEKGEYPHNPHAKECVYEQEEALMLLMDSGAYCGFAWNKLYHLDIIRRCGLLFDTELGMAQDLHFAVRYIMQCRSVAYNPAPAYHYFQHAGGVTNTAMPLTKRKISALQTYLKIAELTKSSHPRVAARAYATLCNMCVHFMYIYYNSGMNEPGVLKSLRGYVRQYSRYFHHCPVYGKLHRLLFRLAEISPRLYYLTKTFGQKLKQN